MPKIKCFLMSPCNFKTTTMLIHRFQKMHVQTRSNAQLVWKSIYIILSCELQILLRITNTAELKIPRWIDMHHINRFVIPFTYQTNHSRSIPGQVDVRITLPNKPQLVKMSNHGLYYTLGKGCHSETVLTKFNSSIVNLRSVLTILQF